MWLDKLNEIKKEEALYGDKLNKAADSWAIKYLNEVVRNKMFGKGLPLGYFNFLSEINGLEFNGYIIYGVDEYIIKYEPNQKINGFIDFNSDREVPNSIILGETEEMWYIYDYSTNSYFEYNYLANEKLKEYKDFEDMLDVILGEALA